MLKVLHVNARPGWRGGEQQLFYLCQGLRDLDVECVVACHPSGLLRERLESEGFRTASLTIRAELDPEAITRLALLARKEHADIVHTHTAHAHSIALLAKALYPKPRLIVHRRVDFSIHKLPFRLALLKYLFGADRFICTSEAIQEVLIADGVPSERVRAVRSVTDLRRFQGSFAPVIRRMLDLPQEVPLIGTVGALVGHKSHIDFIEAIPDVLDAYPSAHFSLVGEGPLRGTLEERTRELNLSDRTHFLGHRMDIPNVLSSYDVFVECSRQEGIGGAMLEAMAMRVPVVGTRAGGIPEVVRDGITGRLVPAADPPALAQGIIATLRDKEETQCLVEQAYHMIEEEFSIPRLAERTLAIYREVAREP